MDLIISHTPNPFLLSSSSLTPTLQNPNFFTLTPSFSNRRKLKLRASSTADPNGADGSSWSQSLERASKRFLVKFGDMVKKEIGVDLGDGVVKAGEFVDGVKKNVGSEFQTLSLSEFVEWNRFEHWKNLKNWDPRRIGALVLYIFVVAFACRGFYVAIQATFINRQRKELTEAYMEALIPEPSPTNIRRFKKGLWRKTMPKGLKMKKFIERPDGTLVHDTNYVGEDAWEDDQDTSEEHVKQFIEDDERLNSEEKKTKDLAISGEVQTEGTWRERLHKWREILGKERLVDQLNSSNAKYAVEFDMKEVENSLRKDVAEKATATQGTRGLWIAKRWWRYRPKLPYNYFLNKLDSSEVEAVVFTEDIKRLYVIMKEGFPLEYVVDIPLDPYLFEIITSSGVEVELLQKKQIHYFLKVAFAFLPGLLILWLIRQSLSLLHITSSRFLYKKYKQLFDMVDAENFILPVGDVGETKSMAKEVVLGGDVWDLLDELMIYMKNPMQFFERDVKFVRGVLLSGPPGTGKTLFARTLANQSGLPFVFASGAEFTDSEQSGAARINEMFSLARRNAPCFIFVDEIDAIAGRHTRKDPRRRATFEALISQLDGEKEKTGVDRVSLRQAVIFICATNRPDELDVEFVRSGRINRRLYIGLPDAEQRIKIFGVHSSGKQLAEDVNFSQLVFRTVGFSGADVRNLVNEAAIMSVRNGHSKIFQQDIVDVLDKQLLEGMGVLITEDEQKKSEERVSFEKKRLLAVHEAGHIVLAHLFPRFDWHAFSQLLPGGKETSISVFYPREDMVDQGYTNFGYLKMQMVVAHGGRCAEHVIFGDDITDGGRDDLEKITKIAREMVISPQNRRLGLIALTNRVGLTDRPDSSDGDLIRYRWDDPQVIPTKMSVELSELFTRELTRFIEETEELAMNALRDNKHILDLVARELLEKSRITGLEVEEKLKTMSPVMFEDFVKPFQINIEEDGPLLHNDRPSSRGFGHESTRMRRRDGDRKSFHDHRDRHRDDKYEGRGKYDSYNRQRGRDYDRHNDYDRDRDTRSRYGAHSKRSRRESRSRSRSRSPSQSESKRTSGFDMAPPATGVTPTVSGQMPGIAHMIQGATQNFSPYGISQIGALSLMQVQPMTQQATRHARRVYVGGLPPFTNEQTIASFFSHVMLAIGGNSAGTGDSVVNVYINHEKKFAFVEMRTVEEASNAMALDGIVFEGVAVRVRRPTDYNPSLAATLGPCQPSSNLNLSAVGLTAGTIGGAEGLDRIFVGGLPYYFTEVQMRELLQAFGPLRNFDIVRDKDTGNSKGYGFCIYQDPAVTDIACASLNGLKMGDKTLTVRRATVSGHSKPEEDNIFARAQQHIAMQKIALEVVGLNIPGVERIPTSEESPTKVLCLTEAVTTEQLTDNGEYEEILEDMRDECRKFGTLMNVVIPRPNPNGELSTGIGKVFLEYSDCTASLAAKNALHGRKFGGNTVTAVYYPEEKYHSMEYDL